MKEDLNGNSGNAAGTNTGSPTEESAKAESPGKVN